MKIIESISRGGIANLVEDDWRNLYNVRGDTLIVSEGTGCGLDTLSFSIKNKNTGDQMVIVNANLSADSNCRIQLNQFRKGTYFFDWSKLTGCMYETDSLENIECGNQKFSHIIHSKTAYSPYSVVPSDLSMFELPMEDNEK